MKSLPRNRTGRLGMISISEVSVFEWPSRFFVDAEGPDRDYYFFWPNSPVEIYPHFVDLSEWFCSCRDFSKNILPFISLVNESRWSCKHIDACMEYRRIHQTQPKQINNELTFT